MPQAPENPPSETKTIPLGKRPPIPTRKVFPKIAEVREMLKERAAELLNLQRRIVYEALANQDYETANDANQFLLTHLPPDENGVRLLDPDIDKPKDQGKLQGPQISIGFALGGLNQTQSLPAAKVEVIDAIPETKELGGGRPSDCEPTVLDGGTKSEGSPVPPERDPANT
jgi:hypothetical protein